MKEEEKPRRLSKEETKEMLKEYNAFNFKKRVDGRYECLTQYGPVTASKSAM